MAIYQKNAKFVCLFEVFIFFISKIISSGVDYLYNFDNLNAFPTDIPR